VEEVINVDVERSNIPTVDKTVLKRILRTFALYHKDITYCQGMNFIAGFFLLQYEDEARAF
jgi:hypothetical protein